MNFTLLRDTREPEWDEHPWHKHIPEPWCIGSATLSTGDFALEGAEDSAVIERKAITDLLGCIGSGRERFERELQRGRYCGRFIVVVEGSYDDLLGAARGLHINAIIGSLAAWQRRYCPFFFAGNVETAVAFALRFLSQPYSESLDVVRRIQRVHRNSTQALVSV